ncbi:collagen alpha-1(I) chain-like [Onychostruthus taczanowskii]|uniref:collagen alpha-1(I) chain-like n=1 Tax=Onychostruthus taczanowskii TaxID=356909 RepID=UPI001B805510|nr:collagen alpha-1(I) chain-like [Onychostruthus taczanowskii]
MQDVGCGIWDAGFGMRMLDAGCPSRGSTRGGCGDRWGAPELHAWSRPQSRPQFRALSLPQSRPRSRSRSLPNPGPAPGPSPDLNPGPNAGPAPDPASGPAPGPNPGPGPWRLPPDRSAASAGPGPPSGARRCSAGSRDRTPAFKHPAKPSAACPPSAPALGTVGPQPHQRRSRLSEAVGSRLAPLCILRDFSSHRQLAKAQGHTGRYSSARPGGTLRDGRESRSGAGAEPGAGTARTAPALPEQSRGSRAAPTPCIPTRGGRQSSCSGPAAALPGRGTEGARQARAKTAVSLGRRGPGTPSPAGEQRPPPTRRSSRQRRHSFGGSAAAVLASCLSPFARRRKGRIRRLRPAGMPGSGGAGTGPLRSRACGEGAPRRHGRPSRPRGPCAKSRFTRGTWPSFGGIYREFAGRDKRFEGRDPQLGPGHRPRPTAAFKAREAARVASLPKRTINRHPPAGAGEVGEPRFPRKTPTPRLRSGRSRRPSLPRPPPKTLGQFPSFLTPRSLLRKALPRLGLGGIPHARHPPPPHRPPEAVASLPRPGQHSLCPPDRRHSNKEPPNLRQRGLGQPRGLGPPGRQGGQPGERVFPHRISRRAGSSPRLPVRGRGQEAGKAQAAGTVPPYPRGPATARSALGSRSMERGHGGSPELPPTKPDGATPRPLPPPGLSQAAQPESNPWPDTIPACPAAWGICRMISPSSASLFPIPGPHCPLSRKTAQLGGGGSSPGRAAPTTASRPCGAGDTGDDNQD